MKISNENLYELLGIDTSELGCMMAKFSTPTRLLNEIPENLLYHDPEDPGEYGKVFDSHVSLLYGLLKPAHETREAVDLVLRDLSFYEKTLFGPADWFSPSDQSYDVLYIPPVGKAPFVDAHQRLSRLPHVNLYPVYTPHLTLAYVKKGTAREAAWFVNRIAPDYRTLWFHGYDYGR